MLIFLRKQDFLSWKKKVYRVNLYLLRSLYTGAMLRPPLARPLWSI